MAKGAPQGGPKKFGKGIHGSVVENLGVGIVSGRFKPGHHFKGEIEASVELKVSRTAYREAIRILAAKGLVESRPKTGTQVTPRARWALLDPDVLAWAFAEEPTRSFIRDLFELRGIIEPAAAALAATRRTGAELAQMGHALEEMARHTLATEEGRSGDQSFHRLILEASRNELLVTLGSSIGAAVSWTTRFKERRGALRDSLPEHRALFEAIAAGDPEAARVAMTELVQMALQDTEVLLD